MDERPPQPGIEETEQQENEAAGQAVETRPREDEKSKRMRLMRHFIENRVLGIDPVLDEEGDADMFEGVPVHEKVNLLYEKVLARQAALKQEAEESEEPVDPYLLEEIKALWADEGVQRVFLDRYSEARMDAKAHRLSELGNSWEDLNIVIDAKEEKYERVSRDLFLQRITREDKLSVAKSQAARLAKELIEKRQTRDQIVSLEELPHIPENTDTAALIHYDHLKEMHRQAVEEGFVWLPSRERLYHRTIGALQNGRWPVLKGEAGTGKSELADAAARALTGEEPTHVACGPRTGERDLIMDKEIDPETGGSYDAYKPLMQAATGYDDSRQSEPAHSQGRVARLDEFNRLDQGGAAYSVLKEARQVRPGSMFHGKPVLAGFSAIGTANPPGPRYPDRTEADAAMRREIAEIEVDYPPQNGSEPELYEFILATLMDRNGHITATKEELAPAYEKVPVGAPYRVAEEDPRLVVGEYNLIEDPTRIDHGFAWRLSYALRAVQDAFNYGNAQTVPNTALRYSVDSAGKVSIVQSGGEPLTLRSSTITLGEIASWMTGFQDRQQKDNPDFQTENFSDWIQYKIHLYIDQADAEDKAKLEAIFSRFHLFDQPVSLTNAKPITPKEIGYLSPRVPRPLELKDPEPEEVEAPVRTPEPEPTRIELHDTRSLMLDDGTSVLVKPRTFNIPHPDKQIYLSPGSRFRMGDEWVAFAGVVEDQGRREDNGKLVVRINAEDPESGLHQILTEQEIADQGEEFWPFTSENLTYEKLVESYSQQVIALRDTKVIELLPSGEMGVIGVDGKEHPIPSLEKVAERMLKSQEILRTKIEQGFSQLLLVPLAKPLGSKDENPSPYVYEGLAGDYAELMRKTAKAKGGKLVAEKSSPSDPEQRIDFDADDPMYFWDALQHADFAGAPEEIIYYPEKFDETAHGGKTKSEILASSTEGGWDILLTQDLAVIPGPGKGKAEGDRPPIEASGRNPHIPSSADTPSIREYLAAIQSPSPDSPYKHEVGLTPEAWLTMAIHKMHTTGEVMDDYQGKGKVSYLLASWMPSAGNVPSACFYRVRNLALLGRDGPDYRNDNCGMRSAVRVP